MKEITHVSAWASGYHAYLKGVDGKKEVIPVSDIRGAVSPPMSENPGYFLILARKHSRDEVKKQPLIFIAEGESPLQDQLFKKMSDCLAKMQCKLIYTDIGKEGFYQALLNNFEEHKVTFWQAPFVEEPEHGKVLIREQLSKKLLEMPTESTLYNQLLKMTPDSMGFAFDSLRFLLGGYSKFRPSSRVGKIERSEYFW